MADQPIEHSFSEQLWHGQGGASAGKQASKKDQKGGGNARRSSFAIMQLSNNLAGASEPHYIAVAGAGNPLANGSAAALTGSDTSRCVLLAPRLPSAAR